MRGSFEIPAAHHFRSCASQLLLIWQQTWGRFYEFWEEWKKCVGPSMFPVVLGGRLLLWSFKPRFPIRILVMMETRYNVQNWTIHFQQNSLVDIWTKGLLSTLKKCSLNEHSWKLSLTNMTPFPTPLQMLAITPFTGFFSLHFTADFFILTKDSTQILWLELNLMVDSLATTSLKEWLIYLLCFLFIDKFEALKKLSHCLFLEPENCPIRSLSYTLTDV